MQLEQLHENTNHYYMVSQQEVPPTSQLSLPEADVETKTLSPSIFDICKLSSGTTIVDSEKIQQTMNTFLETHKLPGVQISIKDMQIEKSWNFSSGYSHIQSQEPLKNNSLMQIGSTTKSFTAALTLLLEVDSQIGRLEVPFDIDQTVGHWLPEYSVWKTITIRQLLNMTSGIYNYTDERALFEMMANDPQKTWEDKELVNIAYSHSLNFQAGTNYEYSNTNYILAGMILEKVSGQSMETLINDRILKKYPDYFTHTSYCPKTYPQGQIDNMAHGYAMDKKKHPEVYGRDITTINLSWASAAGALTSTASDLSNWIGLLFSDNFLPKQQREKLESLVCLDEDGKSGTALPSDSKLTGYGLGVARVYDPNYGYIWTHSGGTLGYHTVFLYMPEKSLGISVIINQMGQQIDDEDDVIVIAKEILNHIEKK